LQSRPSPGATGRLDEKSAREGATSARMRRVKQDEMSTKEKPHQGLTAPNTERTGERANYVSYLHHQGSLLEGPEILKQRRLDVAPVVEMLQQQIHDLGRTILEAYAKKSISYLRRGLKETPVTKVKGRQKKESLGSRHAPSCCARGPGSASGKRMGR
jgi:hypothetical protein